MVSTHIRLTAKPSACYLSIGKWGLPEVRGDGPKGRRGCQAGTCRKWRKWYKRRVRCKAHMRLIDKRYWWQKTLSENTSPSSNTAPRMRLGGRTCRNAGLLSSSIIKHEKSVRGTGRMITVLPEDGLCCQDFTCPGHHEEIEAIPRRNHITTLPWIHSYKFINSKNHGWRSVVFSCQL